jgi:hypothetical protein
MRRNRKLTYFELISLLHLMMCVCVTSFLFRDHIFLGAWFILRNNNVIRIKLVCFHIWEGNWMNRVIISNILIIDCFCVQGCKSIQMWSYWFYLTYPYLLSLFAQTGHNPSPFPWFFYGTHEHSPTALISTLKMEAACTMGHWQHCEYPFDAESSSKDLKLPLSNRITTCRCMAVHGGKIQSSLLHWMEDMKFK